MKSHRIGPALLISPLLLFALSGCLWEKGPDEVSEHQRALRFLREYALHVSEPSLRWDGYHSVQGSFNLTVVPEAFIEIHGLTVALDGMELVRFAAQYDPAQFFTMGPKEHRSFNFTARFGGPGSNPYGASEKSAQELDVEIRVAYIVSDPEPYGHYEVHYRDPCLVRVSERYVQDPAPRTDLGCDTAPFYEERQDFAYGITFSSGAGEYIGPYRFPPPADETFWQPRCPHCYEPTTIPVEHPVRGTDGNDLKAYLSYGRSSTGELLWSSYEPWPGRALVYELQSLLSNAAECGGPDEFCCLAGRSLFVLTLWNRTGLVGRQEYENECPGPVDVGLPLTPEEPHFAMVAVAGDIVGMAKLSAPPGETRLWETGQAAAESGRADMIVPLGQTEATLRLRVSPAVTRMQMAAARPDGAPKPLMDWSGWMKVWDPLGRLVNEFRVHSANEFSDPAKNQTLFPVPGEWTVRLVPDDPVVEEIRWDLLFRYDRLRPGPAYRVDWPAEYDQGITRVP